MTKCSAGSDCPDTAKNCDIVKDSAGKAVTSDKVCQCTTDQLCGGGSSYCNALDKLCETKCSDNTGCQDFNPTRTCSSGSCLPGTTADAGPGDCTTTPTLCTSAQVCDTATKACVAKCTSNASCTAVVGTICDTTSGKCTQCSAATAEPGGCDYGSYCGTASSGNLCSAAGVCANINPQPTTSASSPVIFAVSQTGSTRQDATNCVDASSGNPLSIVEYQGYYYDPNSDVPTSGTYSKILWVKANGTITGESAGNTFERTSINADGTFKFELCGPSSSIQAGVLLKDTPGNKSNTQCIP